MDRWPPASVRRLVEALPGTIDHRETPALPCLVPHHHIHLVLPALVAEDLDDPTLFLMPVAVVSCHRALVLN